MKKTEYNDLQLPRLSLQHILKIGFEEDFGFGDISSTLLPDKLIKGEFIAKTAGVISGIDSILMGYQILDETVEVQNLVSDGSRVEPGDCIARVDGPARALLMSERVILNILQHMSGIATKTAEAVKDLEGSATRICDTRKTLPGLRALQKYAVRCGGGFNHRMRLDDGVMIKDNHIAVAGSITKAVEIARHQNGLMVKIEVECETEEQVEEAIRAGADIIMLDNQTPDGATALCALIPDHIIIELSGGITPETIGKFKNCGAHYISMGSVTHSVSALDISFVLRGTIKNVDR